MAKKKKSGAEQKKSRLSTGLLLLVFLIGMAIMFYPLVSDYYNSKVQSRMIVDYDAAVANLTVNDYSALFEAADRYNQAVFELPYPMMYYEKLDAREDLIPYAQQLDVIGDGIMGYISIEKTDTMLPVYHGTSDAVLNVAVGHIAGSSLPVGGESTHCVLSAHRGLPSARLFTDLDELEKGDRFELTVLDRKLCYEVDQILIVKPSEVDSLAIEPGKDYCTLVTCTPYGINTHRMLVRGHRVETEAVREVVRVPADGVLIDALIVAPILAALLLPLILTVLFVRTRRKKEDAEPQ